MRWMFVLLVMMVSGLVGGCAAAGHVRFAPCPGSPNCVNSALPDQNIAALPRGETVWERMKKEIVLLGGTIVEEQQGYLHATFASKIFGFIDDLECLDDGMMIQIRSAARTGWWDFGVNRKRVETLRRRMLAAE